MSASDDRAEGVRAKPLDLASVFLGPKAENGAVLERLLLEAVRDHIFWRRNFHPEDGFVVEERDKRDPAYEESISILSQELLGLLGKLKGGVPFFSPRYIGHMTSDLTMASVIGYFATMLYNPNNVASEGSPVTTQLEIEVSRQLGEMMGYDAERMWGHLASGGTTANLEALWVARNLKYLAVAVRWAAQELGVTGLNVSLAGSSEVVPLEKIGLWELLNIPAESAFAALDEFVRRHGNSVEAIAAVTRNGLSGFGYQGFGIRLDKEFGDALPPGVVLVPSTAHYSWAKACRILGIGENQLVHVPVDRRFRMDTDALYNTLRHLERTKQSVIACIAVIGSTEESAVDRLHLMADARERAASDLGISFYLHADAAWGGYAAAVTRDENGNRRSLDAALADYAPHAWPEPDVYDSLLALGRTDSITVDPHKLGFMPYPAGAVLFRDARVRDLVAVEAPYLFHRGGSEWGYIGRYILEGSKPGAAAAGVWLSHKVLPLDQRGYGRLVGQTVQGALDLYERLSSTDFMPFNVVPLPRPDMNIVCFAIGHPELRTLEEVNAFAQSVYERLSLGAHDDRSARKLDYFVTKTILSAAHYGNSADRIVEALGFTHADYERAGGLGVIRCTVMNPFLVAGRSRTDFIAGFVDTLQEVFASVLQTSVFGL